MKERGGAQVLDAKRSEPGNSRLAGSHSFPCQGLNVATLLDDAVAGPVELVGRILSGECTLAAAADELRALVERVAAGESSKPEKLGHPEYFVMYKHQNTPSLQAGCRA